MPDPNLNQDPKGSEPVVIPPVIPEPIKEPVKKQEMPPPVEPPKVPEKVEVPKESLLIEVDGQKLTVDEIKAGYMRQKDYTQKTQELADFKRKVEAVSNVLNPPVQAPEIPPKTLTQEELEQILEQRDRQKEQQIALKTEIETLAKEFTGEDGRPKYLDSEVLQWQQENSKMYLSPREAFEQKNKAELLEYEIQNRLKKAGKSVFQEKTGAAGGVRMPEEKKSFITEKGEEDSIARRAAIIETWENLESS